MVAIARALGTPFFIIFSWLSDKVGRKPIMLLGFAPRPSTSSKPSHTTPIRPWTTRWQPRP
jgi:hypothetical protein